MSITTNLFRWRTVDLVTAAMLGVAFGVVFWGWDQAYNVLSPAFAAVPPLGGLLGGPWLLAGVVGGPVVRRPGAALLAELVGANVEYLLGNRWAASVFISGVLQGIGVEIVFAVLLWRRFGPVAAAAAAVLAALLETAYEYGAYDYAT
ncbi:MAG: ECF transporter S component, partial [Rhodoferax sp.]|nr:ECF transporter S component [Actinomycetota bacterium]